MAGQKTRTRRVRFDASYPVRIVAIDGTWCRDCYLEDVSENGAKVSINGTVEGLKMTEFFLALSRTGSAHRRCELIWINDDTMGMRFVSPKAQIGVRRAAVVRDKE